MIASRAFAPACFTFLRTTTLYRERQLRVVRSSSFSSSSSSSSPSVSASPSPSSIVDRAAYAKAERFIDYLLEINQVMNLTGIRDKEEAMDKHVNDCLALLPVIDNQLAALGDAGGGGDGGGGLLRYVRVIIVHSFNFDTHFMIYMVTKPKQHTPLILNTFLTIYLL